MYAVAAPVADFIIEFDGLLVDYKHGCYFTFYLLPKISIVGDSEIRVGKEICFALGIAIKIL